MEKEKQYLALRGYKTGDILGHYGNSYDFIESFKDLKLELPNKTLYRLMTNAEANELYNSLKQEEDHKIEMRERETLRQLLKKYGKEE